MKIEETKIGNVIFLSAEDDAADTILPRLLAVNADISRCHIINSIKLNKDGKASERSFDLSQDINRLGKAIAQIGNVRLVIIDPISAYMGGVDSHNNSEVRGLLAPLAAMAAKHNTAIILLSHLNKSTQQDMIARITGSIGLVAAARAGYLVTKDHDNPDTRYFVPIKNNIGNDKDGFAFHIEGVELEGDITTSKICWDGLVDAHKTLYPEAEVKESTGDAASEFLVGLLAAKPVPAKEVLEEADGAGFSKGVIQRAARKLGVNRKKQGFNGAWEWSLPKFDLSYLNPSEGCEDAEEINDIIAAPSQTFSEAMAKIAEDAAHKTVTSSIPSTPSAAKNTKIPKQKRGKK